MPEFEASIRQCAEAMVEIGIDRAGEDRPGRQLAGIQLAVVHPEFELYVRMIQHVFEETRKASRRHRLVGVEKVAVVGRRSRRHACRDRLVEPGWIEPPLLSRVAFEEGAVEMAADLRDHHVLRGADIRDRLGPLPKEGGSRTQLAISVW